MHEQQQREVHAGVPALAPDADALAHLGDQAEALQEHKQGCRFDEGVGYAGEIGLVEGDPGLAPWHARSVQLDWGGRGALPAKTWRCGRTRQGGSPAALYAYLTVSEKNSPSDAEVRVMTGRFMDPERVGPG